MPGSSAKPVLFWLLAWVLSAALWLVLVDTTKPPELAAGVVVAAIAATGCELARRQRVAGIALRAGLFAHAWRAFASVAPDVVTLTRAAFSQLIERRPARGRVVALPFRHGGDEPRANGRRAAAEAIGSVAPNSIVIGITDDDRLLVHQLQPSDDADRVDPLRLR